MKHHVKQPYEAPTAQVISLLPDCPIASWKYSGSGDDDKWSANSWGADFKLFNASAVLQFDWDDGTDSSTGKKNPSELD